MSTEGTMHATVVKWHKQEAHDTGADEWEMSYTKGTEPHPEYNGTSAMRGFRARAQCNSADTSRRSLISGTEWIEKAL